MSSYGRWALVKHGPQEVEVTYADEYTWIQSAIAGAAAGTFETLKGFSVTLETKLTGPFSGSTVFRW
jgi:hypothetical protein